MSWAFRLPRIARALGAFRGVRRRFDVLARDERMTLVDDYAHHPTAVRATIAAARRYHRGELIVAFQPHRYTRTAFFAGDFADALSGADEIYLAPVYAASEPAIPGVSERSIGEALARGGGRVTYVARVDGSGRTHSRRGPARRDGADARRRQHHRRRRPSGTASARSDAARRRGGQRMSTTTARATATLLRPDDREALRAIFGERVRFDEPLAPYTSWKIGGPADAFVTAGNETELAQLLRFCLQRRMPFGGSWAAGATCSSATAACAASWFGLPATSPACTFEATTARSSLEAGGSADMALVTAKAASAGAAGVDSLAGIPGTVGGSLRMNAGTDREIGEFVRTVWVQSPSRPEPHAVGVRYLYRRSTLERDVIVSRVTLAFARRRVRDVREDMQTRLIRRKKTQPIALPNAGSCFRNPDGDKAARLDRVGRR